MEGINVGDVGVAADSRECRDTGGPTVTVVVRDESAFYRFSVEVVLSLECLTGRSSRKVGETLVASLSRGGRATDGSPGQCTEFPGRKLLRDNIYCLEKQSVDAPKTTGRKSFNKVLNKTETGERGTK